MNRRQMLSLFAAVPLAPLGLKLTRPKNPLRFGVWNGTLIYDDDWRRGVAGHMRGEHINFVTYDDLKPAFDPKGGLRGNENLLAPGRCEPPLVYPAEQRRLNELRGQQVDRLIQQVKREIPVIRPTYIDGKPYYLWWLR